MNAFDISHTLEPTSEQLDAVELLGGPRIFTIERVSKGNAEQPVNVHLRDFPRPWRPGKSMRRVLVACWGPDASQYAGRRVELFCDTEVRFGGQAVGHGYSPDFLNSRRSRRPSRWMISPWNWCNGTTRTFLVS